MPLMQAGLYTLYLDGQWDLVSIHINPMIIKSRDPPGVTLYLQIPFPLLCSNHTGKPRLLKVSELLLAVYEIFVVKK